MHKRRRFKVLIIVISFFIALGMTAIMMPYYFADELYPLDYRQYIKTYAEEYDLNPNFVAGVIFTESRFNPRATSSVGARGIMQIMPGTGRSIALELGDFGFTTDKLYDPATAIRYGCFYLHRSFNTYHNEDYVLMSYNGGGGAVDSYRAGRGLPAETQAFVHKVKSARDMYNNIYGEWWKTVEFEKPKQRSFMTSLTDIGEFWRTLISVTAGLQ